MNIRGQPEFAAKTANTKHGLCTSVYVQKYSKHVSSVPHVVQERTLPLKKILTPRYAPANADTASVGDTTLQHWGVQRETARVLYKASDFET